MKKNFIVMSNHHGGKIPPASPAGRLLGISGKYSWCCFFLLLQAAYAASPASKIVRTPLPGEAVVLPSPDGFPLAGVYEAASSIRPTMILLHMLGSDKESWLPFAQALRKEGFGYLAYDARGHGQSLRDAQGREVSFRSFRSTGTGNDWNLLVKDVDAAVEFLKSRGIAPSSVGFVGASLGANVALNAAVNHPETACAALLSPSLNYRDVLTVGAMNRYGAGPVLIIASPQDRYAYKGSKVLFSIAEKRAGKERTRFWQVPSGHGLRMLKPTLNQKILDWMKTYCVAQP